MNESNNETAFASRVHQKKLTSEFIESCLNEPFGVVENRAIEVARKMERNYPVVVQVSAQTGGYGGGTLQFRIIQTMDADEKEIARASQSVYYWLENPDEL